MAARYCCRPRRNSAPWWRGGWTGRPPNRTAPGATRSWRWSGSPAHAVPAQVAASCAGWNRLLGMLDARLHASGAFVTGDTFTLADIGLGLSVLRWLLTPLERPAYPALAARTTRLGERAGFAAFCGNGTP